ncbi:hypothetical protein M5D96_005070, partial [Drosophila gunungcola]
GSSTRSFIIAAAVVSLLFSLPWLVFLFSPSLFLPFRFHRFQLQFHFRILHFAFPNCVCLKLLFQNKTRTTTATASFCRRFCWGFSLYYPTTPHDFSRRVCNKK